MKDSRWFTFGPPATGTGFTYLMSMFERLPYVLAIVVAAPVGLVMLRVT